MHTKNKNTDIYLQDVKSQSNLVGKKANTSNRQLISVLSTKLYTWSSIAAHTVKAHMAATNKQPNH